MLLFYSQSRAESNAACLEAGNGEINFSVDVGHFQFVLDFAASAT
jgi:hypothetical protein